jgi:hypothetical protein
MKRIYKFPISVGVSSVPIELSKGAKVLDLQMQRGCPTLWFLVDPFNEAETRVFQTYGTGEEIEGDPGEFVGTYQCGPYVWHLFEKVDSHRPVADKGDAQSEWRKKIHDLHYLQSAMFNIAREIRDARLRPERDIRLDTLNAVYVQAYELLESIADNHRPVVGKG